jgi:hypothetical protein
MSATVRRLYIGRAPLRLACKDTPLQIGNEAAKHQEDGHDQVGTAHRLLIEGLDRPLAADRSIEENFMQADYFAGYRHLNLSRDDKGVLIAEIHSNGGAFIMNAHAHTEFVDAFFRIGQDRANKIVIITGAGGSFIGDVDWSSFGDVADPGVFFHDLIQICASSAP